MKQLLLTSDDYGMCHSVNLGITQAMTKGVCKATNFLAPTPWFHEAVALAREHKLPVGVHLCLTCDWDRLKWGPLTANPRLRTEDGSLPALYPDLEGLGATDEDIYDELKAQILLVKKLHGQPSHLDTHVAGGHWRGGIFDRLQRVIISLASEFNITYIKERDPQSGQMRYFKDEACLSSADWQNGFKVLEKWTEPGRYHLYGHAAVDSPELGALCSEGHPARKWSREVRIEDLKFFTGEDSQRRIQNSGFELISVGQMGGQT